MIGGVGVIGESRFGWFGDGRTSRASLHHRYTLRAALQIATRHVRSYKSLYITCGECLACYLCSS